MTKVKNIFFLFAHEIDFEGVTSPISLTHCPIVLFQWPIIELDLRILEP